MEKLVLIQHCQAKHHLDGSVKDDPDVYNGLTDRGQEQARLVAERVKRAYGNRRDLLLYSSDQQRAKETAEVVSNATGLKVRFDSGLREWTGDLEIDGLRDRKRNDMKDHSLFDWSPFAEGPTWREFYARVSQCMARLDNACGGRTLLVVTHGGALSNIVAWWLNLSIDALSEGNPFSAKPGSISVLLKNEFGNGVIGKLNDTSHLDVIHHGTGTE